MLETCQKISGKSKNEETNEKSLKHLFVYIRYTNSNHFLVVLCSNRHRKV